MADYKWEVKQRVCYSSRFHPDSIEIIERVTPSGRAVIGHDQYGKDGYKIGCKTSGGFGGYVTIVPLTPEREEGIARQKLRKAFTKMPRRVARAVSTERLQELADQ